MLCSSIKLFYLSHYIFLQIKIYAKSKKSQAKSGEALISVNMCKCYIPYSL